MKKLMALFVVLVVSGICAQVCCAPVQLADYILVYKVTISGKVVDTYNDEIISAKIQGYWVVSCDKVTNGVEIIDSRIVLYGKLDGAKVYDTVTPVSWDMLLVGETGYPDVDIAVISMELPTCNLIMHGKLKTADIGLASKEGIAPSFAGGALFDGSFFGLTYIMGSGTITAKLDSKLTKQNVSAGSALSVLNTIISNQLVAKNYNEL
jgi:hypothetical protein